MNVDEIVINGAYMFDATDLKILQTLQKDARITNVALGQSVDLSPPPCLRRVRLLEQRGVVLGYHAQLNPKAFNLELEAFAEITLPRDENAFEKFESSVASWPWVRGCYMLAGGADYLIRIVAPDFTTYHTFIQQEVKPLVAKIHTYVVARSHEKIGLPIEGNTHLDAKLESKQRIANRSSAHLRSAI